MRDRLDFTDHVFVSMRGVMFSEVSGGEGWIPSLQVLSRGSDGDFLPKSCLGIGWVSLVQVLSG